VSTAGGRAESATTLREDLPDLSEFTESSLFSLYRAILAELKARGVIRTENAPAGLRRVPGGEGTRRPACT
jgi:hypothetical protein